MNRVRHRSIAMSQSISSLAPVLLMASFPLLMAGCGDSAPAILEELNDPKGLPASDKIKDRLDEVLEFTFQRRLNTRNYKAWQILHGALAYKREYLVEHDGKSVSAVDHILGGGQMIGWDVEPGDELAFDEKEIRPKVSRRGLRALMDEGSKAGQGHADQWFAVLAQCDLEPAQKIQVGNDTYTMENYLRQIMLDVHRNSLREYSWTLIGLTRYMNTDAQWQDSRGEEWSIERLVEIESDHSVGLGACGDTHRLIGIAMALNQHIAQKREIAGAWKKADERIRAAIQDARRYQNSDGSFSSNYMLRPGTSPDLAQNLGTTGHVLEFLTLALTDEELKQPWVTRAVLNLCDLFEKTRSDDLECGALYHAAHGLALYRERMFGLRNYSTSSKEKQLESVGAK